MTFPQSPAIDGIKPDHVRKSNGSLTSISVTDPVAIYYGNVFSDDM